jgi:hypothetical protein
MHLCPPSWSLTLIFILLVPGQLWCPVVSLHVVALMAVAALTLLTGCC